MGISGITFAQAETRNQNQQANFPSNGGRKLSEFWGNVGRIHEIPLENGGTEARFISAFGAPLDNLGLVEVGENAKPSWKAMVAKKNAFISRILAAASQLAPGQATVFVQPNGFALEIRRRGVKETPQDFETAAHDETEKEMDDIFGNVWTPGT